MAKIKILKNLNLLDLSEVDKHADEIYKVMMASSLLFNPKGGEGYDRPGYIFTRFVADCALLLGFDGVKYKNIHHVKGHNVVIFRNKVYDSPSWDEIYKIDKIYRYSYKK